MTKIKMFFRNLFKKEEDKVKVKWSLKKKLLVGGGVLLTSILGVFAYGRKQEMELNNDDYYEDEIDYTVEESDLDETEEIDIEEVETVQ